MKKDIFDQYVTKVCEAFSIDDETTLFKTTRKQNIVDARHMLFYLCVTRPIPMYNLVDYMAERGLPLQHSAIMNGLRKAEKMKHKDKDYAQVLLNISSAVTI
jgi:chromosomal replication initiation ATPase DnaA